MKISGILAKLLLCNVLTTSVIAKADSQFQQNRTLFVQTDNLNIETASGIRLDARLYTPNEEKFPGPRPALVFVSSWALDKYEYEVQARKFAEIGFIVLSYTPRGFGKSDGYVSAAGPEDIADAKKVIDWLFEHPVVDQDNLLMAGISYGGGISLMTAGHDPRVKSVIAMSSWADLCESLYSNNTMHDDWVNILVTSGMMSGRMSPEILRHVSNVKKGVGIAEFKYWCSVRSPINSMKMINERKMPVFVSSNYNDELFSSNQMANFFDKIKGPKKMLLAKGIHFSSEIPGLIGIKSAIWDEVHAWAKHWTGEHQAALKLGYELTMTSGQEFFPDLPVAREVEDLRFEPKNEVKEGGLHFNRTLDSGANSGVLPVLSTLMDAHLDIPTIQVMNMVNPKYAAVYEAEMGDGRDLKLRGLPHVSFSVGPHEGPMTLVAYLFKTNALGVGALLSHGVYSLTESNNEVTRLEFFMNSLATDVEPGHKLTLVIDGVDPLYLSLGKKFGFDPVKVVHTELDQVKLKLPVLN